MQSTSTVQEYADQGIRVFSLHPGTVKTDLFQHLPQAKKDSVQAVRLTSLCMSCNQVNEGSLQGPHAWTMLAVLSPALSVEAGCSGLAPYQGGWIVCCAADGGRTAVVRGRMRVPEHTESRLLEGPLLLGTLVRLVLHCRIRLSLQVLVAAVLSVTVQCCADSQYHDTQNDRASLFQRALLL